MLWPLWGLISAGYQGIIGGRAAKRQFTLLTEDRALPHGPPRYHSNSLRFRRTRAPRPPAVARAMHASSFRQSQLFRNSPDVAGAMLTSRTISWQRPHVCISPARRGVKRGVVSGVKGNRHQGISLSSRGPIRVLSRGYQGIALGYDLGYDDTIPSCMYVER